MAEKPSLCLDFDYLLSLHASGWQDTFSPSGSKKSGVLEFIIAASKYFKLSFYRTSSHRFATVRWLKRQLTDHFGDWDDTAHNVWTEIEFQATKPVCFVERDGKAIVFSSIPRLIDFKPWN